MRALAMSVATFVAAIDCGAFADLGSDARWDCLLGQILRARTHNADLDV